MLKPIKPKRMFLVGILAAILAVGLLVPWPTFAELYYLSGGLAYRF